MPKFRTKAISSTEQRSGPAQISPNYAQPPTPFPVFSAMVLGKTLVENRLSLEKLKDIQVARVSHLTQLPKHQLCLTHLAALKKKAQASISIGAI